MVMPRKKRRTILALVLIAFVAILLGVYLLLYNTTDMFKSEDVLFNKYVSQLIENIYPILNEENMAEITEMINNNKLSSNTNVNIEYTENGNADNGINQLQMNIEGNREKSTGYNYQNVKILQDENVLAGVEYIEEEDICGIRLNGIRQFLSTNLENDNNISSIYQLVNTNYKELISISSEEMQTLKDKYMNIIITNISNASYSKQKDVGLEINGESYQTNAYSITMTKEQFNNIYMKVLEEIKQEDIILSKLEDIDNVINKFETLMENNEKTSNLKQEFIDKIDKKIEEIQSSNIGNDQRTITVFETEGVAIRLSIDTEENFINLDVTNTDENNFINILGNEKIEENEKENSFDLKVQKTFATNEQEVKMNYDIVEEGENTATEIIIQQKKESDSEISNNYTINRTIGTNDLNISIENRIDTVENFEQLIELEENENNILLETLNEEQKQNVRRNLEENISNQLNAIQQIVSFDKITEMLTRMNIIEEQLDDISNEGITEVEKNRFNANFELFEGENVGKNRIIELVNFAKDNLEDISVTQYREQTSSDGEKIPLEYDLVINRSEQNTEIAEEFMNNIKNSNQNSFSVRLAYDEETGLINHVYITVQK